VKKTIIYLVRHAESEYNRDSIISGHNNPNLTDKGIDQASKAKTELEHVKFDEIYSSDLTRARHTAEVISNEKVPKDHQLFELRERNFGALESQPGHKLDKARQRPDVLKMSAQELYHHRYAEGFETDHEVAERMFNELTRLARNNLGRTILVVSHGSSIRSFITKIVGPENSDLTFGSIKNTGYVKLSYQNNKFYVDKVAFN